MGAIHYLAFDLGAESGRAVLGSLDAGKLSLDEVHRFANPTSRINGQLCWNLLQQWEELKTGLRKCRADLSGIGVDTWGVDFGLLGEDGALLGNPVHYRDARTDGMMQRVFDRVPREQVFAQTGIQFMQLNTLYQLMALREACSSQLSAAKTLLFMPDLFNYLFTGQRCAEFSIASTSQMYNPREKRWATELLSALQLPETLLAPVVPSGSIVGTLREDVAKECDSRSDLRVIAPAGHDTASAVAAVPAGEGSWCYISSGTWSLMGVELSEPLINETSLRYNYTNEGGVGGSIRFLKNIMGLWLVQECRRQFARDGYEHSYTELTQMAERAHGFGAVIDPDYPPFLSPGEMPMKIEQFCKQTAQRPPGSRGDVVRTCLESLALTYRRTLEGLEHILGRRLDTIHIVGGGAQNKLLNQMTADACDRKVIAGPFEATAIGNLLVQAMATGDVSSLAEARQIVKRSFDVTPFQPRDRAKWDAAYERFKKVTQATA